MAKDIITNILVKAKAVVGKAGNDIKSFAKTATSSLDKVNSKLSGHNKMVRRMADQNTKAFNLAALSTGPLIRAYAEVAASLWAVERTWHTIGIGAKFQETAASFDTLGKTFGFNAEVIKSRLKEVSGETITTQNLMQNASLALASGLNEKQLEGLTLTARRAARVMGRTMPDAYDRIIRAVTKLEPELLDEIGLTTRLQNILGDYAKSVGKTVDQITSLEKTQIFANEVLAEGERKFGSIDTSVQSVAERMEGLKTKIIDGGTAVLAFVSGPFTTFLEFLFKVKDGIFTIAGAYAIWHSAVVLQSKAHTIATKSSRDLNIAIAANDAAIKAASSAEDRLKDARTSGSTARIIAAEAALKEASAEVVSTDATLANAAAKTQATKATTLLTKASRGFSRVVGFMAGPIGIVITILASLLMSFDAFGASIFGSTEKVETFTDKINRMTESQRNLLIAADSLGVSQEDLATSILDNKIKVEDLGHGYKILTTRIKGAREEHKALMLQLDNGKSININVSAETEAGKVLQDNTNKIKRLNAQIETRTQLETIWDKVMKAVGGRQSDFIEETRSKQSEVNKLKEENNRLITTAIKQTKDQDKAGRDVLKTVGMVDDLLKSVGVTQATLADEGLSSEEKKKVRLERIGELIAHINSLDETSIVNNKELAKLDRSKVLENIKALKNALPGLLKLEEKVRESIKPAKKPPTAKVSPEEEAAKRAIEVLKEQESTRTQILEDTNKFYDDMLARQDGYFTEQRRRAKLDLTEGAIDRKEYTRRLGIIDEQYASESQKLEIKRASTLQNLRKKEWDAIISNDKVNSDKRITALQEKLDYELSIRKMSNAERILLEKETQDKIDEIKDKETLKTGSVFDILTLKHKKMVEDLKSNNEILADGFIKLGEVISEKVKDRILVGLGLVTDKVKEKFKEQLAAAQQAYRGMVDAANQAFSRGQEGAATTSRRALEDVEIGRQRDIADLTAKRNAGELSDEEFQSGMSAIELSVRRKTEDIGLSGERKGEDLEQDKAQSLLDAQLKLNEDMLKANEEYSKANREIWTTMYDEIKGVAISTFSEILAAEVNRGIQGVLVTHQAEQAKADLGAEGASTSLATHASEVLASMGMDIPKIISNFTAFLPPVVGQVLGAAAAATVGGLMGQVIPKTIAKPTISAPKVPSIASFHTGGTISGKSEEVPFIGLKGEGVLNRHNGMEAVGGSKGLDYINSTGQLPSSSGPTNVTIVIKTSDGKETGTLTINNFEDFLRNKGSQMMRNVSKDGHILVSVNGVGK